MPIYPISFCIHESKIVKINPVKKKQLAYIIPGRLSTYIFDDEESYYQDYQDSVYAVTMKKAGWDCMRHYEILANGCVPYFDNLKNCPSQTITHFPKEIILEAMKSDNKEKYIPELLEYTRQHLTTRKMAEYLLSKIDKQVNSVLYLSGDTFPDYLRDGILIGLKEILNTNCVDQIEVSHIYKDYKGDLEDWWRDGHYGKGFTYSRILGTEYKNSNFSVSDIESHKFDIIIYGNIHRGVPYWDLVNSIYKPSEIILLCGEDEHSMNSCEAFNLGTKNYNAFIRELRL
jgi:hypothetical protein